MIRNSLIIILIIFIGILLIPFGFPNYAEFFDNENIIEYVRNVVLIINMILVISFFRSERRYKNELLRFERKSFWYRKIFIEKGYEAINNSIDSLRDVSIYDKTLSEDIFILNVRTAVRKSKREIDDIVDSLRCMDELFANDIISKLHKLEDSIMKSSVNYYYDKFGSTDSIFKNLKAERISLFSLLYKYESEDYRLPKI